MEKSVRCIFCLCSRAVVAELFSIVWGVHGHGHVFNCWLHSKIHGRVYTPNCPGSGRLGFAGDVRERFSFSFNAAK